MPETDALVRPNLGQHLDMNGCRLPANASVGTEILATIEARQSQDVLNTSRPKPGNDMLNVGIFYGPAGAKGASIWRSQRCQGDEQPECRQCCGKESARERHSLLTL